MLVGASVQGRVLQGGRERSFVGHMVGVRSLVFGTEIIGSGD